MTVARLATLAGLYEPIGRWQAIAYRVGWILLGSIAIGIAAHVAIPIGPVPITGQSLVVLLLGAAMGHRLAVATMLAYLAEGAMGLPVFSSGRSGLAMLAGPTAGYLYGFVIAAGLVGLLASRGWDRRFSTTLSAMVLGNLAIYACGLTWLCYAMGLGLSEALSVGVYPFIIGDILKAFVAAWLLPGLWRRLGHRA